MSSNLPLPVCTGNGLQECIGNWSNYKDVSHSYEDDLWCNAANGWTKGTGEASFDLVFYNTLSVTVCLLGVLLGCLTLPSQRTYFRKLRWIIAQLDLNGEMRLVHNHTPPASETSSLLLDRKSTPPEEISLKKVRTTTGGYVTLSAFTLLLNAVIYYAYTQTDPRNFQLIPYVPSSWGHEAYIQTEQDLKLMIQMFVAHCNGTLKHEMQDYDLSEDCTDDFSFNVSVSQPQFFSCTRIVNKYDTKCILEWESELEILYADNFVFTKYPVVLNYTLRVPPGSAPQMYRIGSYLRMDANYYTATQTPQSLLKWANSNLGNSFGRFFLSPFQMCLDGYPNTAIAGQFRRIHFPIGSTLDDLSSWTEFIIQGLYFQELEYPYIASVVDWTKYSRLTVKVYPESISWMLWVPSSTKLAMDILSIFGGGFAITSVGRTLATFSIDHWPRGIVGFILVASAVSFLFMASVWTFIPTYTTAEMAAVRLGFLIGATCAMFFVLIRGGWELYKWKKS